MRFHANSKLGWWRGRRLWKCDPLCRRDASAGTRGEEVRVRTKADLLTVKRAEYGMVTVDMGTPCEAIGSKFHSQRKLIRFTLSFLLDPCSTPRLSARGNPRVTFFVNDLDAIPIALVGPELEVHPTFPERVNVGVAQSSRLIACVSGSGNAARD